eukprot:Protomagalhaensia_sp_Gyna_25__1244@NODE_1620_length_1682_cov_536_738284_g1325_i0_p1_GENE_NODE_1620_length_1682_cov_536_738284_g1325_i0NODE_1620_length_1682_cov_536_738284_g1325_i0_p1_ORF_typecomplete_len335_score47_38His_Phos_1/PF00300_22/1_4e10_NODE_1620_length_1682_cov_536_738284_g1325_i0701074
MLMMSETVDFTRQVEGYWAPAIDKSGQLIEDGKVERQWRIVFIRHGESMWNMAFNKGVNWRTILRILTVSFWELTLIGDLDSAVFDSPLSSTGVTQAAELQGWFTVEGQAAQTQNLVVQPAPLPSVESQENVQQDNHSFAQFIDRILQRPAGTKIGFVASNLRRAISTLGLAINQFMLPEDTVLVTSNLQEVTLNPDGIALALRGSHCLPSVFEMETLPWNIRWFYENKIDWQGNDGNVKLSAKLFDRHVALIEFLEKAATRHGITDFVVCGHSLWLRTFLRHFIPPGVDHPGKHRKISNCGILIFDLLKEKRNGQAFYRVTPQSIELCRGCYL